ncbi:MAG: septum formation inhibitor Maf [Candidatus Levybacteria bacterium]|nr:septum formation inhibitor Maf [Candidatus Levybacteria bacterium]
MKKLILASASPRRKQLLKQIGLEFEVVPSNIEEKLNPRLKPLHQVESLSLQKAQATAAMKEAKDAVVLAADSMVAIDDEIMGKPKDEKDARRMLKKLSGRVHSIVTGFTLLDTTTKKTVTRSIETKVWFKALSAQEIRDYVKKEKPFDKAGAYGIQELSAIFVERIEGDYPGAVGLPLFALAKELKKFGIKVL